MLTNGNRYALNKTVYLISSIWEDRMKLKENIILVGAIIYFALILHEQITRLGYVRWVAEQCATFYGIDSGVAFICTFAAISLIPFFIWVYIAAG